MIEKSLLNSWNKDKWLENKRRLSDCVWCEGALLEHPDQNKVYFAPEPTEFGLVYEINIEDIVEVISTDQIKQKLDRSYKISRTYLRKNAVIVRLQWMLAAELPEDIEPLTTEAKAMAQQIVSASLLDLAVVRGTNNEDDKVALVELASPSPSPSPTPRPSPTPPPGPTPRPGGGGGRASGVRG